LPESATAWASDGPALLVSAAALVFVAALVPAAPVPVVFWANAGAPANSKLAIRPSAAHPSHLPVRFIPILPFKPWHQSVPAGHSADDAGQAVSFACRAAFLTVAC
jgi:hypothetical protein